ncbi:MAG TPA: RDD family protein [Candidatus Dormibacteraeota bacterium]|nr:RDD family protein [Candidatus Dormibacteraeota bacterium]
MPEREESRHALEVPEAPLRRAGFWIRLAAAIVDFMILAVPFAVFVSFLSVAMGISVPFLQLSPGTPPSEILLKFGPSFLTYSLCFYAVSGWAYFALCESAKRRATPGKMLLGLYVGDRTGRRVTFGAASLRFFFGRLLMHVPAVGYYYYVVDCLCVGVLPGKRAIHDRMSGCFVLKESGNGRLFA